MIEVAQPEDAAGIAHVGNMTWLATYPNPSAEAGVTREDILTKEFESEEQINRWRTGIEDKTGMRKIWVARNEHREVVGYSQGKKGETENELWGLFVLPDQQGKGLGRDLMKAALDWLGDKKIVTLSVAEYSVSAINLYKKFGFEEVNEVPSGPSFPSGNVIPSIKMIRPIQDRSS